jgi:hypothetical protein
MIHIAIVERLDGKAVDWLGRSAADRGVTDLHEIEKAASKIEILRARYPEHVERMTAL